MYTSKRERTYKQAKAALPTWEGPSFICPQCEEPDCRAFLTDIRYGALVRSEVDEFLRLNGYTIGRLVLTIEAHTPGKCVECGSRIRQDRLVCQKCRQPMEDVWRRAQRRVAGL